MCDTHTHMWQNCTHMHLHLLYIHLLITHHLAVLGLSEPCNSFAETEIIPQPVQVFPLSERDKPSPRPKKELAHKTLMLQYIPKRYRSTQKC